MPLGCGVWTTGEEYSRKEFGKSLDGKRALITGGSRGIGRGIALKLAEHGVKVAVHYYNNKKAATDTLGKLRERGSDGFEVQADVARPEDIRRMFLGADSLQFSFSAD